MIEALLLTFLAKTKLSLSDLSQSTKTQPSNQACKQKKNKRMLLFKFREMELEITYHCLWLQVLK